jgi:hypothetical protein
MALPIINTRADLNALTGTPEFDQFMSGLAGTLYRLEKDDSAQTWKVVEDDTTLAIYGFTRADFSDAVVPDLPVYDMEAARAAKISEIVSACQSEMDAGFTSSFDIKMDSNLAALQKIKLGYDFALIMGAPDMDIVDFDNVLHLMPMADVLTQMLETGGYYLSLYVKKQTLRAQAVAAATVAELDALGW